MDFIVVAAADKHGGMGHDNKLPWKIRSEMAWFKKLTTSGDSNAVIMGRTTWESIGRPLHGRLNIVLSTTLKAIDGIHVSQSLNLALEHCLDKRVDRVWIIGGRCVYEEALRLPHCGGLWYLESTRFMRDAM